MLCTALHVESDISAHKITCQYNYLFVQSDKDFLEDLLAPEVFGIGCPIFTVVEEQKASQANRPGSTLVACLFLFYYFMHFYINNKHLRIYLSF